MRALPAQVLVDLRELARTYPGFTFALHVTPEAVEEMLDAVQGDPSAEAKGFVWMRRGGELGVLYAPEDRP